MALGALVGASIGLSILGAGHKSKSSKDTQKYNEAVAREDVKLIEAESRQKQRQARRAGARQLGAIQAAAASSGVSSSSGSALDAVLNQVGINAENEFNIAFESDMAKTRTMNASKVAGTAAANARTGFVLGAISDSLGAATTYYAAK